MPFLTREEGDKARAAGLQVVALPSSPPDGLVHYASTKRHFMCDPPSAENKKGSPDWNRVTCPTCLQMGRRTERLDKQNQIKPVIKDMAKPRNQEDGDVSEAPTE